MKKNVVKNKLLLPFIIIGIILLLPVFAHAKEDFATSKKLIDFYEGEKPPKLNWNFTKMTDVIPKSNNELVPKPPSKYDPSQAIKIDKDYFKDVHATGAIIDPKTGKIKQIISKGNEDFNISKIIGSDDRIRVLNTTVHPYSAVAYLELHFENGIYACTGTFIDSNSVVTAAHCISDDHFKTKGDLVAVAVAPGLNEDVLPYGIAYARDLYGPYEWFIEKNYIPAYDFAVINLDRSLSSSTMRVTYLDDGILSNTLLTINGYAGDKPFGTQWYHSGLPFYQDSQVLIYQIDTYHGQSGAPVYFHNNLGYHITGIHSGAMAEPFNIGNRINSTTANIIKNWASSN